MDRKGKHFAKKNIFVVSLTEQTKKPVKNAKQNITCTTFGGNTFEMYDTMRDNRNHRLTTSKKTLNTIKLNSLLLNEIETIDADQSPKKLSENRRKSKSINQNLSKASINNVNKKTENTLQVNKPLRKSKAVFNESVDLHSNENVPQVKTVDKQQNIVTNNKNIHPLSEKLQESLTNNVETSFTQTSGKSQSMFQFVDCTIKNEHTSPEELQSISEINEDSDTDSGNVSCMFSLDNDGHFVIADEKQVAKTENYKCAQIENPKCDSKDAEPTGELNTSFVIKEIFVTLEEVVVNTTSPRKSDINVKHDQCSHKKEEDKSINKNVTNNVSNSNESPDYKKLIDNNINCLDVITSQCNPIETKTDVVTIPNKDSIKSADANEDQGVLSNNTPIIGSLVRKITDKNNPSLDEASKLIASYTHLSEINHCSLTNENDDMKISHQTVEGIRLNNKVVTSIKSNESINNSNMSISINNDNLRNCELKQTLTNDDSVILNNVKQDFGLNQNCGTKFKNCLKTNSFSNHMKNEVNTHSALVKKLPYFNENKTYEISDDSVSDDSCLFVSAQEVSNHNMLKTGVVNAPDNELYNRTSKTQFELKSNKSDHEHFCSLETINKNINKQDEITGKETSFQKTDMENRHKPSNEIDNKTSTTETDSKSNKSDHEENYSLEIIHDQKIKGKSCDIQETLIIKKQCKNVKDSAAESDKTNMSNSDTESDKSDYEEKKNENVLTPFKGSKNVLNSSESDNNTSVSDLEAAKSDHKEICSSLEINDKQHNIIKQIINIEEAKSPYKTKTIVDSKSSKPDHEKNGSNLEMILEDKRNKKDCDGQENTITSPFKGSENCNASESSSNTSISDLEPDKSDHEDNCSSLEFISKQKRKGKNCYVKGNIANSPFKQSKKVKVNTSESDSNISISDLESDKSDHEEICSRLKITDKQKNKLKQNRNIDEAKSPHKTKARVGSKFSKPDHEKNCCNFEIIPVQKCEGEEKDCDVQEKIISSPFKESKNVKVNVSESDSNTSISDVDSVKSDHEDSCSSLEVISKRKRKGKDCDVKYNIINSPFKQSKNVKVNVSESDSNIITDVGSVKSDHEEICSSLEINDKQQNKIKQNTNIDEAKSPYKSKTRVDSKLNNLDHEKNGSNLEMILGLKRNEKDCDGQENTITRPFKGSENVNCNASEFGSSTSISDLEPDKSDHEDNCSSHEFISTQKREGQDCDVQVKIISNPYKENENVNCNAPNSGNNTSISDLEIDKSDHEVNAKSKRKPNRNIEANSQNNTKESVDSKFYKHDLKENCSKLDIIPEQKRKGSNCDVQEKITPSPFKRDKNLKVNASESGSNTSISDLESDKSDHEDDCSSIEIIHKQRNKIKKNRNIDKGTSPYKPKTKVNLKLNKSDHKKNNNSNLEIILGHKRNKKDYDVQEKIIYSPYKGSENIIFNASETGSNTSKSDLESDKSDHEVNPKNKRKQDGNIDEPNSPCKTKTRVNSKFSKPDHEKNCSKLKNIPKQKCKGKKEDCGSESDNSDHEQNKKRQAKTCQKPNIRVEHDPINELNLKEESDNETLTLQFNLDSEQFGDEVNVSSLDIIKNNKIEDIQNENSNKTNSSQKQETDSDCDSSTPTSQKTVMLSKLTLENKMSQTECSPKQNKETKNPIVNQILDLHETTIYDPELKDIDSITRNLKKSKLNNTSIENNILKRNIARKEFIQTNLHNYLKHDTSLSQQITEIKQNKSTTSLYEENSQNSQLQSNNEKYSMKHKRKSSSMDSIEQTELSESLFVSTQDVSRANYTQSTSKSKLKNVSQKSKKDLHKEENTAQNNVTSDVYEDEENLNCSQSKYDSTTIKHSYNSHDTESKSQMLDLEHSDNSVDLEIQSRKRKRKRLLQSPKKLSSPKKIKIQHISCTPTKVKELAENDCEQDSCSESVLNQNNENLQQKSVKSIKDNTTSTRKRRKIKQIVGKPDIEQPSESKSLQKKRRLSPSMSSPNNEEITESDLDSDGSMRPQSFNGTNENQAKSCNEMMTSTPAPGSSYKRSLQAFKDRLEQRTHSFRNDLSLDDLESDIDMHQSKQILNDLMEEVQTTIIANEEELERLSNVNIQITWRLSELHEVDNGSTHTTIAQLRELKPNLQIDSSKFTREEEERVKKNWYKFSREYEFYNPAIFMSSHQLYGHFRTAERLKFKQFLARKLPNRRLATVYRKFGEVFGVETKGSWSKKEDYLLMTLYNTYDHIKEENCAVPRKTLLSKALGRTWMSIHRRLNILLRDDKTKRQMEMEIDWSAELEGLLVRYLLRYTRSECTEDLRYTKISTKAWCAVAAKLRIPVARIIRRWNNHLYPQLFARQPVLKRDLNIELIKWIYHQDIRKWKDIDWTDLSKRCGDLGSNFLYNSFITLVHNFVPKHLVKNCRAAIDYLYTEYLPYLCKKTTSMMLKRVTYDPEERIVVEVEEDEADCSSFMIQ